MRNTVIADTSPLIVLERIERLELLHKIYEEVHCTPTVIEEFGSPLPTWIVRTEPVVDDTLKVLESNLDLGEASAIALSLQLPNSLLLIDEAKGRKIALQMGLSITGTMGLLIKACQRQLTPSMETLIEELESAQFRLAPKLKQQAIELSKKGS